MFITNTNPIWKYIQVVDKNGKNIEGVLGFNVTTQIYTLWVKRSRHTETKRELNWRIKLEDGLPQNIIKIYQSYIPKDLRYKV